MNDNLRAFLLRYADESNRIEAQPIPETSMGRGGHLRALRDAMGWAEGDEPLTAEHLCSWQALIVREQMAHGYDRLPDNQIGSYRTLRVSVGGREAPAPALVPGLMRGLLDEINAALDCTPLDVLRLHVAFERIHPFVDGNGRTGRVLALALARRWKSAPILFTHQDRVAHYYPLFREPTETQLSAYLAAHLSTWPEGVQR